MSREDVNRSTTPAKKVPLYASLLSTFTSTSRARSIPSTKAITASESLATVLSQQQRSSNAEKNQTHGSSPWEFRSTIDLAYTSSNFSLVLELLRSSAPLQKAACLRQLSRCVVRHEGIDPLRLWFDSSFAIGDDQILDVRLAGLALLQSCIIASTAHSEPTPGKGAADKAIFWSAIKVFAVECQVLDLPELVGTVGCIHAICRGGREIQGLEDLVAVLCKILREQAARRQELRLRYAQEEAPTWTLGPPLLDSTYSTPFITIHSFSSDVAIDPAQSALALITDVHKFSWAYLHQKDVDATAGEILSYGFHTTSLVGVQLVLAFIDVCAKYGRVPDARMPDVVELVARVVGVEHNAKVLQGVVDGPALLRQFPSELGQYARTSMRNLLLSPANRTLHHLRKATSATAYSNNDLPQGTLILVLGAVRCLRRTLSEYFQLSLFSEKPPAFEVLPTLINLGMPLLHNDLLNALDCTACEVDYEVLCILEDRFSHSPTPHADGAGVALWCNEWDMVIDILIKICEHFVVYAKRAPGNFVLDLLSDSAEILVVGKQYGPLLAAYRAIFARTLSAFGEVGWNGPVETVCDLFASLRPFLHVDSLVVLLDFYHSEGLCSPNESAWLERIGDVIDIASRSESSVAQRRAFELIIDSFDAVRDASDLKNQLLQQRIMPFLRRHLEPETLKARFRQELLSPLVTLLDVVIDDALTWMDPLPEQNTAANTDVLSEMTFDSLIGLLITVIRTPWSSAVLQEQLPVSRHTRQLSETSQKFQVTPHLDSSAASQECRSPLAAQMTIVLINAFLNALSNGTVLASMRAIIIFRRLLMIIEPTCAFVPRQTKLIVLSMLLRLRADFRHRIHVLTYVDIESFARSINKANLAHVGHYVPFSAAERSEDIRRGRNWPRQTRLSLDRYESVSASRARQRPRSPSWTYVDDENCWDSSDPLPYPVPSAIRTGFASRIISYDSEMEWSESQSATDANIFPEYDLALASRAADASVILPVSEYLRQICNLLRLERDWEVLSYILCYLPDQLTNKHYACGPRASQELHKLRTLLCADVKLDKLTSPVILPPTVKIGDVSALACQILATLIVYRSIFTKEQQEELVETFALGLRRRDIARPCVHALTIACHELSHCMPAYLHGILQTLAQIITTESMAVNALDFIASVGLLPELYRSFTEREYLAVFAIALQYISLHHRDAADADEVAALVASSNPSPVRPTTRDATASPPKSPQGKAFSAYVLHMAYYNLALWFMSTRISSRRQYVRFMTSKLVEATECRGGLDEQAEVCLDMLARYAVANLRPNARVSDFHKIAVQHCYDARLSSLPGTTWMVGHALITTTRLDPSRWTEITIRRPSGIVKALFEIENADVDREEVDRDVFNFVERHKDEFGHLCLASMEEDANSILGPLSSEKSDVVGRFPAGLVGSPATGETGLNASFLAIQMSNGPEFGSVGPPIILPQESASNAWYASSVRSLDNTPVIDVHAIGCLYVGPGQSDELDIFSNTQGSKAWIQMLQVLGDVFRLKDYDGYTGGLDRTEDLDGKWMLAWANNVTQIVFHVASFIPVVREKDPQMIARKRHLGNDAVKIIFNDSGGPYDFRTVKGQFNWVNIIVEPHTPAGRVWHAAGMASNEAFYKVYMQLDPSMPELGPLGAFKMVSAASLGQVVRHLALHADIYAKVHLSEVGFETAHGQQKVEFTSNWRKRLQIIKSIRNRLADTYSLPRLEGIVLPGTTRDVPVST